MLLPCISETGEPLVSYQNVGINILQDQVYINNENGQMYKCTDASNQNALVWTLIS